MVVGGFMGGEVQLRNISISWLYAHAIKSPMHIWPGVVLNNINSNVLLFVQNSSYYNIKLV